jgi:hypothetical protein
MAYQEMTRTATSVALCAASLSRPRLFANQPPISSTRMMPTLSAMAKSRRRPMAASEALLRATAEARSAVGESVEGSIVFSKRSPL